MILGIVQVLGMVLIVYSLAAMVWLQRARYLYQARYFGPWRRAIDERDYKLCEWYTDNDPKFYDDMFRPHRWIQRWNWQPELPVPNGGKEPRCIQ